jgi:hypothetical protein
MLSRSVILSEARRKLIFSREGLPERSRRTSSLSPKRGGDEFAFLRTVPAGWLRATTFFTAAALFSQASKVLRLRPGNIGR